MIKNVTITGGTHGNELIGIYLVKKFLNNPDLIKRSSFTTKAMLLNKEAIKECRRYIDRDLNRCFNSATLDEDDDSYEAKLAKELDQKLGPKGSINPKSDFIVDLHTTTANMGLTIVVSNSSKLTWMAISYLKQKEPNLNVYRWMGDEEDAFVDSIALHGFAIEVGAVPQGVLRADLFLKTEQLIYHLLDFIQKYNSGESLILEDVEFYNHETLLDYPRDRDGDIIGMVHELRQDRDYDIISTGDPLFRMIDGDEFFYEGEDMHTLFINEAAYYEKGFAMTLAKKAIYKL